MNKTERQGYIIKLIEQSDGHHLLATREIADQLGVSEMTIRRDLRELSQDGLLLRQHGGATAAALRPRHYQQRKEIGILLVSKSGKYTDPFYNAILEGVDRKLQELGYRIAYINTQVEITTATQARDLLQYYPVSGMILVGPPIGLESIEYLKANVTALVQTTESLGPDQDTVTFDGYYGMRLMIDHLVNRGYRRLGFLAGGIDLRHKAFVEGVRENGLHDDENLCVIVPFGLDGWTPELGHVGAERLMQLPEPPDAIVCASDRIAIGTIQWLHQNNFRVPEDIAVTGFDNIADSAFTSPSLTTVHVHKQLMGEIAAERAVKRIENDHEIPLLIQTPTYLVIRESCGSER